MGVKRFFRLKSCCDVIARSLTLGGLSALSSIAPSARDDFFRRTNRNVFLRTDIEQASLGSGGDKPLPYVFDGLHDVGAGFMPALCGCSVTILTDRQVWTDVSLQLLFF